MARQRSGPWSVTGTLLAAFLCLFAAAGCGGGGHGSSEPSTTRKLNFDVLWEQRSRHIEGPASAQSLRVQIIAGSPNHTTVSAVFNRPAITAETTQHIVIDQEVRTGRREIRVNFFTQPDATGTIVGTSSSFVEIKGDGSGADEIQINGLVRAVQVPDTLTLTAGDVVDYVPTVRGADGSVIPVSPGSIFRGVQGGNQFVEFTADGQLRAKAAGSSAIFATVDGVDSASTTVTVIPRSAVPRFTINWAARSRAVTGLSSARSVVVQLTNNPDGPDVALPPFNRNTDPAAYSQTYQAPNPMPIGGRDFTAVFYADPDGQGAVVGVAGAPVNIDANGDGIDTVTINTVGTIASVEVAPNQVLPVGGVNGARQDLAFVARDQNGTPLAISPGSLFWTLVSGTVIDVRPDGSALANAAGKVTVQVSVDGIQSAPMSVSATTNKGGINVGVD